MNRIVVIGGYGGFGAKVCQFLAENGNTVLVAGRSTAKAETFCSQFPEGNLIPVRLDRDAIDVNFLKSLDPCLLIDASGPFQAQDFTIPETCISAGIHYLDLADGREFVNRISALNRAAMKAGICVISGASTLPALSTAVTDFLVKDLDGINSIRASLSASNRLSASPSVTKAILSYAGKKIRIWRGGIFQNAVSWQEARSIAYQIEGTRPHLRTVRLCDVPDLDSLPDRYPGRPATEFRAGSDIWLQDFLLWILTWPVKWGWLDGLSDFNRLALQAQRFFSIFGSSRSAMEIRIKGRKGTIALERKWTVIADHGDGMWIPAMAAPLLANRILNGEISPGAKDAGGLLKLEEFRPCFDQFSIKTEFVENSQSNYLYHRVMGEDFNLLPQLVQNAHKLLGDHGMIGSTQVTRGNNPLAVIIANMLCFPASGSNLPAHVHMREEGGVETWIRNFNGQRFTSKLSQMENLLVEQFGPLKFAMELRRTNNGLSMHIRKAYFFGVRFPLAVAPRIEANENEAENKFHFHVDIALPIVGRIIQYKGELQPAI